MKSTLQKGFSTIELLIAFSVAIIFISGAMMVAFGGQTAGLDALMTTTGLNRTETQIGDAVRSLKENWSTNAPVILLNADASYTHTNNDPSSITSTISNCRKNIESSAQWNSEHGRTLGISFGTALVNMEKAKEMGPNGCNPFEAGPWQNPINTGWDVSPSATVGDGTDVAIARINGTTYAFMTSEHPSAGKPDILASDISNPQSPGTPYEANVVTKGLNSLVVYKEHAYALQNLSTNQLQVIDVSSPNAMTALTPPPTIPNITCAFNTSNCNSIARSIAYYDGYLYIGTGYIQNIAADPLTNHHEFHVYCIDDPSVSGCTLNTPKPVGSFNVDHNVNDIAIIRREVAGTPRTYALLATSVSSPSHPELTVLDVTDAKNNNITPYGDAKVSGNFDGMSVFVVGDTAYLGRTRATSGHKDFYAFDISGNQLLSPNPVKEINLGLNPGSAVIDVVAQGRVIFLLIDDPNDTFRILDGGAPVGFAYLSACNTLNLPVSRALTYWNNFIYIINKNQATLNTIKDDSANACTP